MEDLKDDDDDVSIEAMYDRARGKSVAVIIIGVETMEALRWVLRSKCEARWPEEHNFVATEISIVLNPLGWEPGEKPKLVVRCTDCYMKVLARGVFVNEVVSAIRVGERLVIG